MTNEDFDTAEELNYNDAATNETEYRIDGIPKMNYSKHTIDIKEIELVQLNIDLIQREVAGNDNWGSRPESKYLIKGDNMYSYGFYIVPYKDVSMKTFANVVKKYATLK